MFFSYFFFFQKNVKNQKTKKNQSVCERKGQFVEVVFVFQQKKERNKLVLFVSIIDLWPKQLCFVLFKFGAMTRFDHMIRTPLCIGIQNQTNAIL